MGRGEGRSGGKRAGKAPVRLALGLGRRERRESRSTEGGTVYVLFFFFFYGTFLVFSPVLGGVQGFHEHPVRSEMRRGGKNLTRVKVGLKMNESELETSTLLYTDI